MLIPVTDLLLLPGMSYTLRMSHLTKEELHHLQEMDEEIVFVPLKKYREKKELLPEDFRKIGVTIDMMEVNQDERGYVLYFKVLDRVEVTDIQIGTNTITGSISLAPEEIDINEKSRVEIMDYIKDIARDIAGKFSGSQKALSVIEGLNDLNILIGHISQFLPLSNEEKYVLMEISSLKTRSLTFIDYFIRQKEAIQIQLEMSERFSEKTNKNYREAILREQLKAIQEELNEGSGNSGKKDKDYKARIENSGMPDEIRTVAEEELGKLETQSPASPDYNVIQNYLDFILALPWSIPQDESINIGRAREILEGDHYGLEKVKDRIIQHLAVMHLKKDKHGSILLLVGPPGTGKTSLGKSIAKALNRKYVRLSLGGIRDEAEIRGHRRTYVGAMPGRVLQEIKKAGVMNPVMVLDEVDKLMTGYNGDPASALLEVLDPEQNDTFIDHYLDLPYDLSNVFFVATANSIESIPGPLLDRMEVIQISSYTSNEKFHIGKEHLVKGTFTEYGLRENDLIISDEVLEKIITDYTMEAGVRGLKKQIEAVVRYFIEKIVLGTVEKPYSVKEEELETILGKKVSRHDMAQENNPAGVVTGMAWTPIGGEILFIEATDMPGSGQIILTGKLGDVMKESARISLSLLKSRLPMNVIPFKEKDIHIHVPSGAVPKDGPSAGITLFTALASLVTGIRVNGKLAMTGEVTLRGAVLPIGGIKEKLLAADRAGIETALIPRENVVDLKDVPQEIKNRMKIIPVDTIEDVLREALGIALPKPAQILTEPDFYTVLPR